MYVVHNILKLFLIISSTLIYLVGLGWLIVSPMIHGGWIVKQRSKSIFFEIPLLIMSGLIINYGLTLIFQSLSLGLIAGGILSLIGLVLFVFSFIRHPRPVHSTEKKTLEWIGISFMFLITIGPILTEPIANGDARTMWFFYAKMIYFAGNIGPNAGWTHPSVSNSHVDYPIFVPILAAQITYLAGFWNEYLPKISLLLMYVPAIIWLFAFLKKSFSFFFLILLIPFSFFPWIWTGTMDGLFASYFAISMLLLSRYLRDSQSIDLISSLSCLFAVLLIKNEGALAVIAGTTGILSMFFLYKQKWLIKSIIKWKYIIGIIVGILPFLMWMIYLKIWNIQNDLEIGSIESIKRILLRIINGSIFQIFHSFIEMIGPPLLMLGIILFFMRIWKISFDNSSYPILIASAVYFIGMVAIYLLTPHDLTWHLEHSIFRTTLPINSLIFIVCFLQLSSIENTLRRRKAQMDVAIAINN